jgi:hypothetical protein
VITPTASIPFSFFYFSAMTNDIVGVITNNSLKASKNIIDEGAINQKHPLKKTYQFMTADLPCNSYFPIIFAEIL